MPVITYTAKREIEKTAFFVSGSDISVDGVDDSFNSLTNDLSGLLDNEWANVVGFAAGANNGWFQANGNSTTAKITQDTSTVLVTEAVGAAVTIQGHVRGLGVAYTLDFDAQVLARSGDITQVTHTSEGGNAQTLKKRHEFFWDVVTVPIEPAALPQFREFIHSVDAGETFTFDAEGRLATPVEPVLCDLQIKNYKEQRVSNSNLKSIAFRVRVIPGQ